MRPPDHPAGSLQAFLSVLGACPSRNNPEAGRLLAGKVFRLGHMGSQANESLVDQAVEALREVIG